MKLNLNTKLIPIVIFSLVASSSILAIVSINNISETLTHLSWEDLDMTDKSVTSRRGDYLDELHYRSIQLSIDSDVEEAIQSGNIAALKAKAEPMVKDAETRLDTIVFLSADGKVMAEIYNDSKLKIQTSGKNALARKEHYGLASVGTESLYLHSEHPVQIDGKLIGAVIVGSDIFSDNTFSDDIKKLFNSESTFFLGDVRYGTSLINPDTGTSIRGTKMTNERIKQTVLVEGKEIDEESKLPGFKETFLTAYTPLTDMDGKVIGMRMIGNSTAERNATNAKIRNTAVLIAIASVLLFGIINWLVIRNVLIKPIRILTQLCGRLQKLDLSQDANVHSTDELGELAQSTNAFVDKIREVLNKLQEQANTVGAASEELAVVTKTIQESTLQSASKLQNTVSSIEDMNKRSATAKQALEDVSSSIITISSSAEEMTATIGEIANNSSNARTITAEATDEAVKASGMIKHLGEAAQEISTVTESISSISAQTNILALNATIEAARAGAAGKGFAVVANEIKNLAQETESATGNIHGKVSDIQSSTGVAVSNVEAVTKVINDVNSIVTSIAAAIEEQSAVTRDISSSIGNISNNIQASSTTIAGVYDITKRVTEDINTVEKITEGITTGNTQISASATDLARLSHELRTSVEQFKL